MKNKVIKTITAVMAVVWLVSVSMADSASYKPMITLAISTAWLVYFFWCNGWFVGVNDYVYNR